MDEANRRDLAREVLTGYVDGPEAATRATVEALARAAGAEALILVEGISDQIALETLAERRGRDLTDERVVVLPVGGAHGLARYLARFGPSGANLELAGLCDAAEEDVLRRSLVSAGLGPLQTVEDMERSGFHVCREDLEDELIRAVGPDGIAALFDSQGDLGSFRTLQMQPAWRGREVAAQMRRFLGAGARRKLRYARLLVQTVDLDRVPRPLDGVLAHV